MADLQFLFPGHPLVRGPGGGGGGGSSGPPEYNPGLAHEFLDEMANRANPFGVASWLWKKEVDNIADAWKVGAPDDETKGVTSAFLADYGQEELEDLPGSKGFKQNINPVDWLSDPGKQIGKTLTNSWETIADWDDFKQRTKREMWLGKKENGTYVQEGYMSDERSPFYVANNPVYKDVLSNVAEFMGNNKSSSNRNKNHRKATKAMGDALSAELNSLPASAFDKVDGAQDVLAGFNAQMGVVDGLSDLDDALDKVNGALAIKFLTTADKKGEADEKIQNLMNVIDGDGTAPGLLERIEAAESSVGVLGEARVRELAPVKAYVQNLRSSIVGNVDGGGATPYKFNPGSGNALQRTVAVQRGRLFRNTADEGIGGRYQNKVVRHNIYNKDSQLNEVVNSADGVSPQGRNIGALMRATHRDYDWQTAMDLVNAWDDGKLIDQYIWGNLVRPRIERWTPSYWVGRGLKKTNYFGLTKEIFENNVKVNVPGIGGVALRGGEWFSMDADKLKVAMESGDFVGVLNGTAGLGFDPEVAEIFGKSGEFLKKNAAKLGLKLNAAGDLIEDTVENRAILESVYGRVLRMKNSGNYVDPGRGLVSIMGRYTAFLNRVQNTALVKVYNVVGKLPEVALQKVYVAFGRLLEWALGTATEGVGLVIAWIARILFAKLAKQLTNFSKEAFKALRKGDISVFFEEFEKAYNFILKAALFALSPILLIVVLVIFLNGVILTTIPSFDATRVGGNVVGESIVEIPLDPEAAGVGQSVPAGSVPSDEDAESEDSDSESTPPIIPGVE